MLLAEQLKFKLTAKNRTRGKKSNVKVTCIMRSSLFIDLFIFLVAFIDPNVINISALTSYMCENSMKRVSFSMKKVELFFILSYR
jgi:hypothetical protein